MLAHVFIHYLVTMNSEIIGFIEASRDIEESDLPAVVMIWSWRITSSRQLVFRRILARSMVSRSHCCRHM